MSLVLPYNRTDINVVRFSDPIDNGLITATNTGLAGNKLTFNSNQINIATTPASALVYTTTESNFNILNLPETTANNSFVITKNTGNSTWKWTNILDLPLTKYESYDFVNLENQNSTSISLQNSSLYLQSDHKYIALLKASITFNNLIYNSTLVQSNSSIFCIAGLGNSRSNVTQILSTSSLLSHHSVNITNTTNNTNDITIIIPNLAITSSRNFIVTVDTVNNKELSNALNSPSVNLNNLFNVYPEKISMTGTLTILEYKA